MFWSCNTYIPVPFSDAVNVFCFFFFLQDPDACNADVSDLPVYGPMTVNVKMQVLLFILLFLP